MEFIGLALMVRYGTPVILLVLLIMTIVNTLAIRTLNKSIDGIIKDIVWRETYLADKNTAEVRHEAICDRIKRLEDARI